MQKSVLVLVVSSILVVLGLVLLAVGNQIILEEISQDSGLINSNQSLVISTDFNTNSQVGIFAVQLVEYKDNAFTVQVLDPFSTEIFFESIKEDAIEREFNITSSGMYKLIIQSNNIDGTQVFGAIGPVPDAGKKSLGFISVYVLMVGLAGLAISGIFAIKKRRSV